VRTACRRSNRERECGLCGLQFEPDRLAGLRERVRQIALARARGQAHLGPQAQPESNGREKAGTAGMTEAVAESEVPHYRAEAPLWMPDSLIPTWDFLATYPIVLSLIVMVVGIGVAVIGRGFVLKWGNRLISRTSPDLGPRLIRIVANVAALVVGYIALVLAIQVIGLSERVEQTLIRILLSLLILRLIKSAMRASHIGLEILSRVRDRYEIVEERTLPLFDLIMTILIIGAAAYATADGLGHQPDRLAGFGRCDRHCGRFCRARHPGQPVRRLLHHCRCPLQAR
jgi:hypothetical protein